MTNEFRAKCWEMGVVAPWYLRNSQLDVYEILKKEKLPFVEASRQWGKTTTILSHVLEELRTPKADDTSKKCFWFEPQKNQARDIVQPEIDNLQKDCPGRFKFKWRTIDSFYEGPKGARLYVRGVNEDKGESSRGKHCDIIVCDEFGSWRDPDYILDQVLRPMLLTTNGQLAIVSTPPRDLGHLYYRMKDLAMREKRFIQKTIYDNESLSPERILEIMEQAGGKDSAAWRREYLCEAVSEPERLIVPEYSEGKHDVEDDYPYPQSFDTYVGMDLGMNDYTAVLFAYNDFTKGHLVIDHEILLNGKNTKQITDAAKTMERELWGPKPPYRRVSDNDIQQIHDMATMCNYSVIPTRKDEKLAAINGLRLRFTANRIKVKKRCRSLRWQLKTGLWNERRTDFQRTSGTGHLDAIAALVYLNRNVDEHHNPFPEKTYDTFRDYAPIKENSLPKDESVLRDVFRPFRKALW